MRRTILAILAVLALPTPAIPASKPAGHLQAIKPARTITQDGFRVQLDLSNQVLRLSVPEDRGEPPTTAAARRRRLSCPRWPSLTRPDSSPPRCWLRRPNSSMMGCMLPWNLPPSKGQAILRARRRCC